MKHIKLFENNRSIQSMRNIVNEYDEFFNYITPIIMEKYNELAEDEDYEPDRGDAPTSDDEPYLQTISDIGGGFEFYLQSFNNNGEPDANYHIELTDEELEELIIRVDSKKYNL